MPTTSLSPHFSLEQLTLSVAAKKHKLKNTPDAATVERLRLLCAHVLEPLRELYGAPLYVNSGYRSPEVNAAVGGVRTSQHLLGEAADITTGSLEENRRLLGIALEHARELGFDQLIAEKSNTYGYPRWLHISYSDRKRRQQFIVTKGS